MNIKLLAVTPEHASQAHQHITQDLPEYFGLPEANEQYARGIEKCYNLAIRKDDKYIGLLSLDFPYPNNGRIYWMGILRNEQGKGLGRLLIQEAEKYALEGGATTITVETLSPQNVNEPYLKTYQFYEACGFTPLFNLKPEGHEWDMVYMMKALTY